MKNFLATMCLCLLMYVTTSDGNLRNNQIKSLNIKHNSQLDNSDAVLRIAARNLWKHKLKWKARQATPTRPINTHAPPTQAPPTDKRRRKNSKHRQRVRNKLKRNQKRKLQRPESSADLKRPFHVALQIDRDYFPVATFGNFTANEISTTGNYIEYRRRAARYGAHNRWKHLDPHLTKVKNQITRVHNIFRSNVSPPASNMLAMSWDDTAAEHAQKWAEQCKPTSGQDHPSIRWTSSFGTCGQNVHVAFKKKRWRRVARYWWSERSNFRFGQKNNASLVQQYTQMVWSNSHKVGCGFAECASRNGKTFYRYVCNYCPAGNNPSIIDKPYTIGRRCSSCEGSCRNVCKRRDNCKLCTNSCPFSDLWSNCQQLGAQWKDWLCNTKTAEGIARFKNCRATCQCQLKIT